MAKSRGVEWESLEPQDPNNPTNKRGYKKLPPGAPCANCQAFKGLSSLKTDRGVLVMSVDCQPDFMEKRTNRIAIDPLFKNSGAILTGLCVLVNNGYQSGGWPAVEESEYQTQLDHIIKILAIMKCAPTENALQEN